MSDISNLHARAPCDTLQAERVPPNDLAYRQYDAAATALPLIVAFFSGAFLASMAIESDFFGRTANGYAVALLGESTLLLLFTTISPFTAAAHPRVQDAELPTSGSRRPAGFAGGAARCPRWLESSSPSGELRRRGPRRSRSGCSGPSRRTFTLGAIAGALVVVRLRHATMVLPSVAVLACAAYAFLSGRRAASDVPPGAPNSRR